MKSLRWLLAIIVLAVVTFRTNSADALINQANCDNATRNLRAAWADGDYWHTQWMTWVNFFSQDLANNESTSLLQFDLDQQEWCLDHEVAANRRAFNLQARRDAACSR